MDVRDVLGTPILLVTLVSLTLAFAAAVAFRYGMAGYSCVFRIHPTRPCQM